jgi:hypothetical protein
VHLSVLRRGEVAPAAKREIAARSGDREQPICEPVESEAAAVDPAVSLDVGSRNVPIVIW